MFSLNKIQPLNIQHKSLKLKKHPISIKSVLWVKEKACTCCAFPNCSNAAVRGGRRKGILCGRPNFPGGKPLDKPNEWDK